MKAIGRIIFLTSILGTILFVFYFYNIFNQKEQTPLEYVQRVSKLKLPEDLQQLELKHEVYDDFLGDKTTYIRYAIDNEDTAEIIRQCHEHKYNRLPVSEESESLYNPYSNDSSNYGYYYFKYLSESDKRDVRLIIINISKMELFVFEIYM